MLWRTADSCADLDTGAYVDSHNRADLDAGSYLDSGSDEHTNACADLDSCADTSCDSHCHAYRISY